MEGITHLGGDGVYRSFNRAGEVVDYKQLSPDQIRLVVHSFEGLIDSNSLDTLKENLRGVDGREVTSSEELLQPGPKGRPARSNN